MRIVFLALVCAMVIAGLTTQARPKTPRQWAIVWAVLVLLAWSLLGFAFLRSA